MLLRDETIFSTIVGVWTTVDHPKITVDMMGHVVETLAQSMVIIVPTIDVKVRCMESIVPKIAMAEEVVTRDLGEGNQTDPLLGRIRISPRLAEIEMDMGHLLSNAEILSLLVPHHMVVIEMDPLLEVNMDLLPEYYSVMHGHVTTLRPDRDEIGKAAVQGVM
jgi:hypothetical protein